MEYTLEIEIDQPREKVSALFLKQENLAFWQPGFISAETISGDPGAEGSKTRLLYDNRGRKVEMVETITVFNTLWSNAYDVVDFRLGWDSGKNWNAAFWIRNLTDEDYYRGGGPVPDVNDTISRVGLLSDPRIFGVSIGINFGE